MFFPVMIWINTREHLIAVGQNNLILIRLRKIVTK